MANAPAPQDTCNAVEKDGRRTLICELPLGHYPASDHKQGEITWRERGGW